MKDTARAIDALAAAALTAAYAWLLVVSTGSLREWPDTIAYALPGANAVRFGTLALPQLGSQVGFDRFWLFNAPWVVVAPLPAFWLAGPGRMPHLAGLVAVGLINWTAFTIAARRLFAVSSLTVAMLVAFAFLGTRGLPTADLYGQKYSVAAFALVLCAFYPSRDPNGACSRPWWQWLAAGLLPLVHVVVAPAVVVWLLAVVASDRTVRGRSWTGPLAFLAACVVSAAWYFRPSAFEAQLWPHLAFGGFRRAAHFGGLFDATSSAAAALPTWCLSASIAGAALVLTLRAIRATSEAVRAAAPAIALVVTFFIVDAWRGFLDYGYFLFGAGPAILATVATRPAVRTRVVAALAVIGVANIAISTRLDRSRTDWTTTTAGERFVAAHTDVSDRIVLGPPFVFAAATLPPERTVPRVVPQPYFLDAFDRDGWLKDLNTCCNVYVGSEESFLRPVRLQAVDTAVFPDASIERVDFRGQPVIVARRRR